MAFWATPVGLAARAKLRGDRFFQIALDDATLTAYAESAARPGAHSGGRRARRTCDLLGQIEELGWHLEHVGWWRADTDETVSAWPAHHAQPDTDHVRGVYLFHSEPRAEQHVAAVPGTTSNAEHEPTHRRDVG